MSEKDTIVRQRLLELERKHAKALRKLQRVENRKQRRKTFSGFTVKDKTSCSDAQNRSSILLSQEMSSPGDTKSSPHSAHKKGLLVCKSVTFKDTVETDLDQQPLYEKKYNKSGRGVASKEKSKRRSAPVGSCNPDVEDMSHDHVESNSYINSVEADKQRLISSRDSFVLCDNVKLPEVDEVVSEQKDCSKSEDDQDHNAKTAACSGVDKDVTQISSCNKENSDSVKDICFVNNEKESTATVVEHSSIETVVHNRNSLNCNSDVFTNEDIQECLPKGEAAAEKAKDAPKKKDASSCFSVHDSGGSFSENRHWLHLFEEEFPRRSPRLQSTPRFRRQAVVSEDYYVMQPKKTKSARSKQCRPKKEVTAHSRNKTVKCSTKHTTLCDNLPEKSMPKGFVFPRPFSEQTKPGGPLGVVVDFSLPDKEFAKLKLAKIKGALPADRISREVNDKTAQTVKEHDSTIKRSKGLLESRCSEIEEDCSHHLTKPSLTCSVKFVSEIKSNELETVSAAETLEGKSVSQMPQSISTSQTLGCEKHSEHSECSANNSSSSLKHQIDPQMKKDEIEYGEGDFSTKESLQQDLGMVIQAFAPCQVNEESAHEKYIGLETSGAAHSTGDNQLTDDVEEKTELNSDICEEHVQCDENDKQENQNALGYSEKASDNNNYSPLQCGSGGPGLWKEIQNEREPNDIYNCPKTDDLKETSAGTFSFEVNQDIHGSPEQHYDQGMLFNSAEQKSSLPSREPSVGDQATPHGKMAEPLENSQLSCMTSLEDRSELTPMLMMACLQHYIEGERNIVRSVSLSSYEPSTEKDVTVLKKKRDVLAVCLAHLVVIWTVVPGLQWTVLHKWSLPTNGEEEFVSVQVVPMNSHVVLLVGGNFHGGNGRILGYSEEGEYSLDLEHDLKHDKASKCLFSTMCLLHDNLENKINEDVEFVIGNRSCHEISLTKWTLDSCCLLVEQHQHFTPVITEGDLSSLQAVHGSHCLLLGTTDDKLFLWNHKTCQQLRNISLHTLGFGHMSCLEVFAERGLLFLMMACQSIEGIHGGVRNDTCLLLALNPKTSKMKCLEYFCLAERFHTVGTNGQYIAIGHQATGEVNMWNITDSQRQATLQVFQDDVRSIGFHQESPVVAFGSASGCVHLFSLC